MQYRRLPDGTHVVGFTFEKRFIVCTSAFNTREAKALVKAIGAVVDLFHATSGGWVTMVGAEEVPRGASAKVEAAKGGRRRSNLATKSRSGGSAD